MGKITSYPKSIKRGSAVVKIYRAVHRNTKNGFVYQVMWNEGDGAGRKSRQFTDAKKAELEGTIIAGKLASGQIEAAGMSREDRSLLHAIKQKCGSVPPLSAINEWAEARNICGEYLLTAARAFANANGATFEAILATDAVDAFIKEKDKLGKQGTRTYGSKLKRLKSHFSGRHLHTITVKEWTQFLELFENGVTRNDIQKRAKGLCIWARKNGHLPRGIEMEIMGTERAAQNPAKKGIIAPETLGKLLIYLHSYHPHYLAPAVIAAFCGLRTGEIHGTRKNPDDRQTWKDVHLEPEREGGREVDPYLNVTAAKQGTPAERRVPLGSAAISWLSTLGKTGDKLCDLNALERVRNIGKDAGLDLPENCFRHSYISYQITVTGSKARVAVWAGNSEKEIDRHYRKPVAESAAIAWFLMTHEEASKLPKIAQKTPAENGAIGGASRSPSKIAAVTRNAEIARAAKSSDLP